MTTIAEKIVSIAAQQDAYGFVPFAVAEQSGLPIPEDCIQYGDASPFCIAMRMRARNVDVCVGDNIPNIQDVRGYQYQFEDGSWILYRGTCGQYAEVGDGKIADAWGCDGE